MGFGFNLFFIGIVLPLLGFFTVNLALAWVLTRKIIYGKMLGVMWASFCMLILVVLIGGLLLHTVFSKKILAKSDYYGQYIVDRSYFRGKQADWQYNSFRFEIKDNDSLYFYETNRDTILQTYTGTIRTNKSLHSEVLVINMREPTHHVVSGNPIIYCETWGFYLVFTSPKFKNMYFRKGTWKRID